MLRHQESEHTPLVGKKAGVISVLFLYQYQCFAILTFCASDNPYSWAFREADLLKNFKGTSGAVIPNEPIFITSLKTNVIPSLPSSTDIKIFHDSCFGEHDWTRFPQFYSESLCHLVAVLRQPNPNDLQHPYREYGAFWCNVNSETDIKWNESVQLSSMTIDSFNIQVMVATTQCFWLELVAALDYMEVYKPIMDGHAQHDAGHWPDRLMGAFTSDMSTVQFLLCGGIPAYFIQPLSTFNNQVIERVVKLAQSSVDTTCPDPGYPIVFTGDPTDPKKYYAIHTFLCQFQHYTLPFHGQTTASTPSHNHVPVVLLSSMDLSLVAPSSRPVRSKSVVGRHEKGGPASQRKKKKGSKNVPLVVRNKFEDLSGIYAPPPIPAWMNINALINKDPKRTALRISDPHDNHYFFPDPGMLTFANAVCQKAYFQQLDHCFDILVYRSTTSDFLPLHPQKWHDLLALPLKYHADDICEQSSTAAESSTQCRKRFDAAKEMLGSCMHAHSVIIDLITPPANSEEPFNPRHGQELVWQLYDQDPDDAVTNFRMEHQNLILEIFPEDLLSSVSLTRIGVTDMNTWMEYSDALRSKGFHGANY
ncbi:uncharacterized protein EV420DRAFT_1485948 [Desarmillaria tabescens]|uniref:Uncharacterized protein n=1 Tax=Armillaria tabescens TaxID=1929756 RepID=A0AA39JEU5_ARMTA|nr:uncharacterized protein EV420DRAFT_1485948 [Desarmillaria tabescens]KAK0440486.1 hypothetical protein EV420DRAFT_1485948 [Desarmillaria tabescens]